LAPVERSPDDQPESPADLEPHRDADFHRRYCMRVTFSPQIVAARCVASCEGYGGLCTEVTRAVHLRISHTTEALSFPRITCVT
jgi:hypothetical protein